MATLAQIYTTEIIFENFQYKDNFINFNHLANTCFQGTLSQQYM